NFSPLTLRRQQFGVIAATVIMLTSIPAIFALKQPTHMVPMDIGPLPASMAAHNPVLVSILPTNEIQADSRPVTLSQLESIAKQAKGQNRAILIDPDVCSLHHTLARTVAVVRKTGHKGIRLVQPRFPIQFKRATSEPEHIIENAIPFSRLSLPNRKLQRFQTINATTIVLYSGDCGAITPTY
ncbi:MAG: hypothetical protein WA793_15075, partial [Sphingorhabdus sp.]|uniref:hypothetical protein n=1 Tax=Sphingorhabdus sp. TaxID=1902408 RepID=UPI003CA4D340